MASRVTRIDNRGHALAISKDVGNLIAELGKAEQTRQNRQQRNLLINLQSQGMSLEQAAFAVSQTPPQFSEGLGGIIQKISGGASRGPSFLDQVNMGLVNRQLNEPTGIRREQIESQIKATDALAESRTNPKLKALTAGQEKQFDASNIAILRDPNTPAKAKGRAIDNLSRSTQITKTLTRDTDQNSIFQEAIDLFKDDRIEIDQFGPNDKRFGEQSYIKAMQKVLIDGVTKGFTPESIGRSFQDWWDEQAAANTGRFREFESRENFSIDDNFDAPAEAAPVAAVETGEIRVQHPDGRTGTVSADELEQAIQEGFIRIEE